MICIRSEAEVIILTNVNNFLHHSRSILEFPVILLHYVPISMHYSQDHCQNDPGALKQYFIGKHTGICMTILLE